MKINEESRGSGVLAMKNQTISNDTLQNVKYGQMKMQQENSTIRIDPSNSTVGEFQGNSSRPNFDDGLGKIRETPEESKVDKHTPPSRLLSSADMHQSPISFGSNSKMP